MTVRAELLDRGVLDALAEVLDESVIPAAIERALTQLREQKDHGERRAAVEKELAAIAARERNLAEAVARWDAPDALIAALKAEQTRRKALEAERAALGEREKLAGLTAAEVTTELRTRVQDLRGLLGDQVPKVRQVLRALEASFTIVPAPTPSGGRGIRFVGTGNYRKVTPEGLVPSPSRLTACPPSKPVLEVVAPYLKALRSQARSWSTFPLALFLNAGP